VPKITITVDTDTADATPMVIEQVVPGGGHDIYIAVDDNKHLFFRCPHRVSSHRACEVGCHSPIGWTPGK